MANKVTTLLNHVEDIYRKEGLTSTIKRIINFIVSAKWYENSIFYVYEHILDEGNEVDYLPEIQNVNHRIIETVEQLDELLEEGYDLSLVDIEQTRNRLEQGAILFLVFINCDFASVSWAALTREAKDVINPYPYKVDFTNNEACGGRTWVNPKYRQLGLFYFSLYKKEQYLITKGVIKHRSISLSTNTASQRAKIKMGHESIAIAHYIRVFDWHFWREKPIIPLSKKGN